MCSSAHRRLPWRLRSSSKEGQQSTFVDDAAKVGEDVALFRVTPAPRGFGAEEIEYSCDGTSQAAPGRCSPPDSPTPSPFSTMRTLSNPARVRRSARVIPAKPAPMMTIEGLPGDCPGFVHVSRVSSLAHTTFVLGRLVVKACAGTLSTDGGRSSQELATEPEGLTRFGQ